MKTKVVIGLVAVAAALAARRRLTAAARARMAKCSAMCSSGCHAPSDARTAPTTDTATPAAAA